MSIGMPNQTPNTHLAQISTVLRLRIKVEHSIRRRRPRTYKIQTMMVLNFLYPTSVLKNRFYPTARPRGYNPWGHSISDLQNKDIHSGLLILMKGILMKRPKIETRLENPRAKDLEVKKGICRRGVDTKIKKDSPCIVHFQSPRKQKSWNIKHNLEETQMPRCQMEILIQVGIWNRNA